MNSNYQIQAECKAPSCAKIIGYGDPQPIEDVQCRLLALEDPLWLQCSSGHFALYARHDFYAIPKREVRVDITAPKHSSIVDEVFKDT